jgi:ribulose 1,5-bisphosphate carboxylase large subunit-like protein
MIGHEFTVRTMKTRWSDREGVFTIGGGVAGDVDGERSGRAHRQAWRRSASARIRFSAGRRLASAGLHHLFTPITV